MKNHIHKAHIILFVGDQEVSCRFYEHLLRRKADLHVPGMSEFHLSENLTLGLMPAANMNSILDEKLPDPALAQGVPRCELYLYVKDVKKEYEHALSTGARMISPLMERNWGDMACYFSDPDGHLVAFAQKIDLMVK
jgi:uncharacterized glyoxalase superfamily protein PhnB